MGKITYLDCWKFISPFLPVSTDYEQDVYLMTFRALKEADNRSKEQKQSNVFKNCDVRRACRLLGGWNLQGIESLTWAQKKILAAYARCNMSRKKTAETCMYTAKDVDYHLRMIEVKTGLNPHIFYDLVQLLQAVEVDNDR